MSGRKLIIFGILSVGIGAVFSMFISRALTGRATDYEVSAVDPKPVLEPWVERTITIDARDRFGWSFFDFSRGSVVTDATRATHNWDLAFQRYRVRTNSGVTHPRGGAGIIKVGRSAPAVAPLRGYQTDTWEGDGGTAVSHNPAFRRWYRYSPMANGLVSRGNHYIIRTADRGYARLKFLSYTCPTSLGGGMGCVTFRYGYRSDFSRKLEAP